MYARDCFGRYNKKKTKKKTKKKKKKIIYLCVSSGLAPKYNNS